MAALGLIKTVSRGNRVRLNDGGPITGSTGTLDFTTAHATNFPADFTAVLQVVGTLGSVSVDLQASLDGGVTFNNVVATVLTAAAPIKLTTLVDGAIWRLNLTAGPTSGDIWISIN
jgi:hypothetical protein